MSKQANVNRPERMSADTKKITTSGMSSASSLSQRLKIRFSPLTGSAGNCARAAAASSGVCLYRSPSPCSLCERKHSNPGNILSVKFVYRFPPRHPTESACMQRVFPRCTWVNCAMMHRCPFGASTIGRFCVSAEYWNVIGSPACGK